MLVLIILSILQYSFLPQCFSNAILFPFALSVHRVLV